MQQMKGKTARNLRLTLLQVRAFNIYVVQKWRSSAKIFLVIKKSVQFKIECGDQYLNLTEGAFGTITSPNYPEHYPSGLHCEWVIEVGKKPLNFIGIHDCQL